MFRIVFLDTKTLGDFDKSLFESFGKVSYYETTNLDTVFERIKDADIVVTNKVKISRKEIEKLNKLKLICVAATGTNNIDLSACGEKKIMVKNVSGYSTNSVVQLTFSFIFHFLQNLIHYREFTLNGLWQEQNVFTYFNNFDEISSRKFGIIGLGTIGRRVGEVAKAFGCEVCYYSTSGNNVNQEFKRLELNELLQTCDIISIHAPLNERTQNLLTFNELKLLKKGSILLNLGRGGIICENSLADFFNKYPDRINVGLDVLEQEPIKADHRFLNMVKLDNFILTPHMAWSSNQARMALIAGVKANIVKFIQENSNKK
jgi:lactate dehydrogenase-like 2-hydroxyacid dehydrogenase